jgi:hypothetical protein
MATRVQAKSLTEEVETSVAQAANTSRTWFDRLPAEQQRELLLVKEDFLGGRFAGTVGVVSSAIIAACRARGIRTAGKQGVMAWLKKTT